MRRALPVLAITAIGVGALAAFHSSTPASGNLAALPPASTAPPATAPPPAGTEPAPATTAPAPTSPSANTTKATYDGEAVDNRYGTVQVRVTVQGKKIIAVDALQLPNDRERSAYSAPMNG